MRANRKRHSELPDESRRRANARAYAHTYIYRGKLERGSCEVCGIAETEMHHPDYSKPLEIVWLCRPHHLELHKNLLTAN